MMFPPWRIGSPSFCCWNTSQGLTVATSGGRPCRQPEDGLAHPRRVLAVEPSELEPVLRPRAVARDDRSKLVPVRLGVRPDLGCLIQAQLRVRNRQAELPQAWDVDRQELLAQLFGRLGLDPPVEVTVLRAVATRTVHLHERSPPPVERLLDE